MVIPWEVIYLEIGSETLYILNINKLSDKPISCIYKLNFPNGKCYIGQTCDIRRRMYEHNNINKLQQPCDYAILKYGKIEDVEILEEIQNDEILNEREIYWINYYSSNNKKNGYNVTSGGKALIGENSHRAKFSKEDVYNIRLRKYNGEFSKDVYKDYSNYSKATFEKVWQYKSYPNIGKELYKKYNQSIYSGENTSTNKLTNEDVIEIRNRYKNGETIKNIHDSYKHIVGRTAISNICNRITWKHL